MTETPKQERTLAAGAASDCNDLLCGMTWSVLEAAKCPQCDGSGVVVNTVTGCCQRPGPDGECCGYPEPQPEPGPCQWCDERSKALDSLSHMHENNPDSAGDDCKKCGLDLRNPIHARMTHNLAISGE